MNKKRYLIIVGIVAAVVALSILFYTMLANHRPVITSLEAQPERVLPRGSCQIVCNATDPDGDELSYGWSANGGGITGEGATVTWTAPGSVGSYNVTAMVIDSRGGGVTDYVTITVRTNSPPTINSLIANADWTLPSGSLNVTCDASDPDGDELSYEWTTTGGNITGTGTKVIWTAPPEVGICNNVTVVVKDGHGREDTRFVTLCVATGTPPTIEDLTVTPQEPKYFKTITEGYYKVGKTKQYDIECTVSDASGGVFYEWSCTGGNISGEGSLITWTAPDETLTRTTVTVIVSDIAGNMVSKSVDFQVVSCSACTFG
jgi:hypothetical protein